MANFCKRSEKLKNEFDIHYIVKITILLAFVSRELYISKRGADLKKRSRALWPRLLQVSHLLCVSREPSECSDCLGRQATTVNMEEHF